MSLDVCQLFCGEAGALWPKPTGHLSLGNFVLQLNPDEIQLHTSGNLRGTTISALIRENIEIVKKDIGSMGGSKVKSGGRTLIVHLGSRIAPNDTQITLGTDESYILQISELDDGRVCPFFGTVFQNRL